MVGTGRKVWEWGSFQGAREGSGWCVLVGFWRGRSSETGKCLAKFFGLGVCLREGSEGNERGGVSVLRCGVAARLRLDIKENSNAINPVRNGRAVRGRRSRGEDDEQGWWGPLVSGK